MLKLKPDIEIPTSETIVHLYNTMLKLKRAEIKKYRDFEDIYITLCLN